MSDAVPLELQITEVGREIALRRNVYKKRNVKDGDERIRRMEGVLETLRWLQEGRVVPGAPRMEVLIAALMHIRRNCEGAEPDSKGEHFIDVVNRVLGGAQVVILDELAIAARQAMDRLGGGAG